MIQTRFGNPVTEVRKIDERTGNVIATVCFEDGDTVVRNYQLSDLKADDGIKEIYAAAKLVVYR